MQFSVHLHDEDIEKFRKRVLMMSDAELIRQGKAARYMCSPKANLGKPPRQCFVDQLNVLREEWRSRHPNRAVK